MTERIYLLMGSQKNIELEKEKVRELEYAALNLSPNDIAETCARIGKVEYSARALGIACRFRGVECVRALVEGGADLRADFTNYMIQNYGSYGDDLSVLLLDNYPSLTITYFVVVPQIYKSVTREDGTVLKPLPFEKRVEVLDYLRENSEKAGFDISELLYYAILLNDKRMETELDKRGAELSDYRKKMLTDKGKPKDLCIWTELLKRLSAENFVPVLTRLTDRLNGKKLHSTDSIYDACSDKFYKSENLEFYLEHFDDPKLNKTKIMKTAIDNNDTSSLEFAAREGWLKPKKRDEMIQYSSECKSAECTAWLLDFKNLTADPVAERAAEEKKAERELNSAPDSVTVLKTLWSYKKREDGTIIITNYKGGNRIQGNHTEITVPANIGKSAVTAIYKEAFSPFHDRVCRGRDFFKTIEKIIIPDSISEIGENAFDSCWSLRSVNIPEKVTVINARTFEDCRSLESIVIPQGVTAIGEYAFFKCGLLKTLVIPEGVEVIGDCAFSRCSALETIVLPNSLKSIGKNFVSGIQGECFKVIVPCGSYAEEYCKINNIPFVNAERFK